MADIELVIKISKSTYEEIKRYGLALSPRGEKELEKALKNGTPLPEHHGRLIDISEYEKYFNTAITYDDGNHEHVVYTDRIPTIIEADRGE